MQIHTMHVPKGARPEWELRRVDGQLGVPEAPDVPQMQAHEVAQPQRLKHQGRELADEDEEDLRGVGCWAM